MDNDSTTTTTSSGEPTTQATTTAEQKPRRKLSLTDKLTEMRDSHVKALTQLRDREIRLSLDLERIRGDRQKREDELRRLNGTLPAELRVAPESLREPRTLADDPPGTHRQHEQVEGQREPWHGDQPLGQAQ